MTVNLEKLPIKYSLDHIGVAVESLENGAKFYKTLGLPMSGAETVASEKVNVQMFELANSCRIELLEATEPDSPVGKFLQKRGPGIHHICLRVDSVTESLKLLRDAGYHLIHEKPIQGAHNCLVAFVHPKSTGGVLIELSQKQSEGKKNT